MQHHFPAMDLTTGTVKHKLLSARSSYDSSIVFKERKVMQSKCINSLRRESWCFIGAACMKAPQIIRHSSCQLSFQRLTRPLHTSCAVRAWQALQCRAASTAAARTVILVESPAKAKKIQQFLGTGYQVTFITRSPESTSHA